MPGELNLYLAQTGVAQMSQVPFGKFTPTDVNADSTARPAPALRLTVTWSASDRVWDPGGGEGKRLGFDFLSLGIEIRSNNAPTRLVGRVYVPDYQYPSLRPTTSGTGYWKWELTREDIEFVESAHTGDQHTPHYFTITIEGLVRIVDPDKGTFVGLATAHAESTPDFRIAASDWINLVTQLGYRTPPSVQSLLGVAALGHPSWIEAENRLVEARRHLRLGEDKAAVVAGLHELEGIVTAPYDRRRWEQHLAGTMLDQKTQAIAELMSGIATWANRVGHHRDRSQRDAEGDLVVVPLDHWEAEIALAQIQLALTYALRLRASGLLLENVPEVVGTAQEPEDGASATNPGSEGTSASTA